MPVKPLHDAKYIALETFRKNGQGVKTPVWMVSQGEYLSVWTAAKSGKVKRIRNDGRVRVCASDWRGKPLGDWIDARARVHDDPSVVKSYNRLLGAKYGLSFWAIYWPVVLIRKRYVIVEISPSP